MTLSPILALAFSFGVAAPSGRIVVKLATLAPRGSPYHQVLEEMAQKWREASGGTVELRIYPGGVAGGEGDMIRKIGIGELQAASLTTVGMHDITPEPAVLDVPGLIATSAELDSVLPRIRGRLERALAARGFVVVGWATVGTARFFSVNPLRQPADARDAKLYSWEGDPGSVVGWEAAGFRPVVLSATDITPSLATGMIDVLCEPPLFALVSRTFERTRHMLDFDWSLLSAATVVRSRTWERIPPAIRTKLLAIGEATGQELSAEAERMNQQAIAEMKRQGLVVDAPADPAAWRIAAERTWPVIRGREVPADLFDDVRRLVQETRAGRPVAPGERAP